MLGSVPFLRDELTSRDTGRVRTGRALESGPVGPRVRLVGEVARGFGGHFCSIITGMPGPTSSNDLLLELMRESLAERARDLNDGLSVRSLSRRVEEHAAFDEKRHGEMEGRIRDLEKHVARSEGVDTGRFQLPPPQQLPAVAVNLKTTSSKRPSAFIGAVAKDPKTLMALIGLLTVLAHAILRLLR